MLVQLQEIMSIMWESDIKKIYLRPQIIYSLDQTFQTHTPQPANLAQSAVVA